MLPPRRRKDQWACPCFVVILDRPLSRALYTTEHNGADSHLSPDVEVVITQSGKLQMAVDVHLLPAYITERDLCDAVDSGL